MGWRCGTRSPASLVRMRFPGSLPSRRRRSFTGEASRIRAAPSTNAFVSSAARAATGEPSWGSARATRSSNASRATPRWPSRA